MTQPDLKQIQSDLEFIKRVMQESRRAGAYGTPDYLAWGILVIAGFLLTYLKLKGYIDLHSGAIWGMVIVSGLVTSIIIFMLKRNRRDVETFGSRLIIGIWSAIGLAMITVGFLGTGSGAIPEKSLTAVLFTILGIGYYLSGLVYGEKWVSRLALGWWLGACVLYIYREPEALLFSAFMMLVLQVIPGWVFLQRFRQEISR